MLWEFDLVIQKSSSCSEDVRGLLIIKNKTELLNERSNLGIPREHRHSQN